MQSKWLSLMYSMITAAARRWLMPAFAGLMAACGPQLAVTPTAPSDLSGEWRLLTPSRSELLAQLEQPLNALRAEQGQRQRRSRQPPADIAAPDGDLSLDAPPVNNWQQREAQQQQGDLLNAFVPAEAFTIEHSGARIEFVREGVPRRRFAVGASSMLVTRYGEWRVASGWQGNAFVVYSRDSQQKFEVVERYQRSAQRLEVQVELKLPGFKQILLASYQRQP